MQNKLKYIILLLLLLFVFSLILKAKNNDNIETTDSTYYSIAIHDNYYEIESENFLTELANKTLPKNKYNIVFIFIIIIFIITIISVVIFIYSFKLFIAGIDFRKKMLKSDYTDYINEYLFADTSIDEISMIFSNVNTKFRKNILIGVLIELYMNFTGDTQKNIQILYKKLKLDIHSEEKLSSKMWNVKLLGMKELSIMQAKRGNKKILKILNSKNDILRKESQLVLVKLLPFVPFAFLDALEKPFSLWEQINIYNLIINENIEQPEYSLWLNSKNNSVVIFALRMIMDLRQIDSINTIVLLLKHKDSEVRKYAIITLGKIGDFSTAKHLIKMYETEHCIFKPLIIKSLSKMSEPKNIEFFVSLLSCNHYEIRLQSCYAIKNIGRIGLVKLNEILNIENTDKEIKKSILHVLDKLNIN